MTRLAQISCVFVFLLALGCAKEEDYMAVAREQRAAYKELADLLATVKDEKTMDEAKASLQNKTAKFEEISRKARALPKPSADVQARLKEDEFLMTETVKYLGRESERVSRLPGGPEFMNHFKTNSLGIMSAVQR